MSADAGLPLSSLRVDGGASRNNLLLQIQADTLGVPVLRSKNTEATAVGAAYLAGMGCGLWRDENDLASRWELDRVFEPAIHRDQRDERFALWKRAVDRSRAWA
jgi:glycerol kinase